MTDTTADPSATAPAKRRRFTATLEVDVDIDIDAAHLEEIQGEEWARYYFSFDDEEDALTYVARCVILFGRLGGLDGHAHQPKDVAEVRPARWELALLTELADPAAETEATP